MARTYDLHALFSEEELNVVHKKMADAGVQNRSAYFRKMALDGYIVKLDMKDIHELVRLLRNATNNLNQIAKLANSTGRIYYSEISDIQAKQDEIWKATKEILARLSAIQ